MYICAATKGRLASIFRNTKKQPVHVTIVKAVNSATNELFPPMIKLLKEVDLDPIAIREKRISAEPASNLTQTIRWENFETPAPSWSKIFSPGFHVTYLGKVEVGKQGDTKQIDKAGKLLLSPYKTAMHDFTIHEKVKKKASFEIGEIGIKVVDVETKQVRQYTLVTVSIKFCLCSDSSKAFIHGDIVMCFYYWIIQLLWIHRWVCERFPSFFILIHAVLGMRTVAQHRILFATCSTVKIRMMLIQFYRALVCLLRLLNFVSLLTFVIVGQGFHRTHFAVWVNLVSFTIIFSVILFCLLNYTKVLLLN